MTGSYNPTLVALSVLIAMCASYVALDLAGRTTVARRQARRLWIAGGSTAMGLGMAPSPAGTLWTLDLGASR